jgi:hypothetical protein
VCEESLSSREKMRPDMLRDGLTRACRRMGERTIINLDNLVKVPESICEWIMATILLCGPKFPFLLQLV